MNFDPLNFKESAAAFTSRAKMKTCYEESLCPTSQPQNWWPGYLVIMTFTRLGFRRRRFQTPTVNWWSRRELNPRLYLITSVFTSIAGVVLIEQTGIC